MATTTQTHTSDSLVRITAKTPPTRIEDRMQTGTDTTITIDAAALERELRAGIKGEVRFSAGDRAMYASDASNYRMIPIGVVLPVDAEDVEHVVAVCRRHGAPILNIFALFSSFDAHSETRCQQ